jgi:hypothetical protein
VKYKYSPGAGLQMRSRLDGRSVVSNTACSVKLVSEATTAAAEERYSSVRKNGLTAVIIGVYRFLGIKRSGRIPIIMYRCCPDVQTQSA